jgi:hypothetical protein
MTQDAKLEAQNMLAPESPLYLLSNYSYMAAVERECFLIQDKVATSSSCTHTPELSNWMYIIGYGYHKLTTEISACLV